MRVVAFPRMHLGLLDLAGATPRRFGGVGLMLQGPPIVTTSSSLPTGRIEIDAPTLDMRTLEGLKAVLDNARSRASVESLQFRLEASPPSHSGFGVTTALRLSALVHAFRDSDPFPPPQVLQEMSGRGETSGIGIHGFFVGGALWDAGHPAASRAGTWLPSSHGDNSGYVPPLAARKEIPTSWRFSLMMPESRASTHGRFETDFFRRNTPIPETEALEALSLAYHGLLVAFHEGDFDALKGSLSRMGAVGFKKREIDNHGTTVRPLLRDLARLRSVAPFMSSMGPLICAVWQEGDDVVEDIQATSIRHRAAYLGTYAGRNAGYVLQGDL